MSDGAALLPADYVTIGRAVCEAVKNDDPTKLVESLKRVSKPFSELPAGRKVRQLASLMYRCEKRALENSTSEHVALGIREGLKLVEGMTQALMQTRQGPHPELHELFVIVRGLRTDEERAADFVMRVHGIRKHHETEGYFLDSGDYDG